MSIMGVKALAPETPRSELNLEDNLTATPSCLHDPILFTDL